LRSFTIVGDFAQASTATHAGGWADILASFTGDNWRLSELTVNYRTPERITDAAADVATRAGRAATRPKAVLPRNYDPQLIRTDNTNLEHVLGESVHTQLQRLPGGLIGILVAAEFRWHFQQLLEANFAHRVWTGAGRRRHRDIVLVSAQQAKGLE